MVQTPVIIDTNIVLDCFVFKDPNAIYLRDCILSSQLCWIATQPMEEEFLRVLSYPNILCKVELLNVQEQKNLLTVFKQYAQMVDVDPANVPRVLCLDKDDQIFIDLALAQQGILLSKDKEVLKLNGRKSLIVMGLDQFKHSHQCGCCAYADE